LKKMSLLDMPMNEIHKMLQATEEENRVDRTGWKEISDAAQKRYDDAVALFDKYLKDEKRDENNWYRLLQPQQHLTDATWRLFRKHVEKNDFQSRRLKLTDDEKAKAHEKRLAPVYYVEVRKKGIIEKRIPKRKLEEDSKEETDNNSGSVTLLEDGKDKSKKKQKKEEKKKSPKKKTKERKQKIQRNSLEKGRFCNSWRSDQKRRNSFENTNISNA